MLVFNTSTITPVIFAHIAFPQYICYLFLLFCYLLPPNHEKHFCRSEQLPQYGGPTKWLPSYSQTNYRFCTCPPDTHILVCTKIERSITELRWVPIKSNSTFSFTSPYSWVFLILKTTTAQSLNEIHCNFHLQTPYNTNISLFVT